jgi:hypothetical protein
MGVAIGFVAGSVWTAGAFITLVQVYWTGPFPILFIGWPLILGYELLQDRK